MAVGIHLILGYHQGCEDISSESLGYKTGTNKKTRSIQIASYMCNIDSLILVDFSSCRNLVIQNDEVQHFLPFLFVDC